MAVVIPLAAAAFSASAGLSALAIAGTLAAKVAGYAMVAGGALTGVGALTGKKDLMKAGSILSLAGGIGGAISKSAAAAGSSAGASGAGAASGAGGAGAASGTADALFGAGGQAAGPGLEFSGGGLVAGAAADAAAATGSLGFNFGAAAGDALSSAGGDVLGGGMMLGGAVPSTLQKAASVLTPTDIGGFLKQAASKVGDGLEKFSPWVRDNKELVDIGSRVVSSMYGPEAEMADDEKRLMDRAYRNINSPVKLYNYGRGG